MSGLKDEIREFADLFRGRPASAWRALGSPRLFFWVAPLILIACVAGTLIPQGADEKILGSRWGQWPLSVILAAGLNDVFYQWWFLALLGLFGLNLVACSVQRARVLRAPVWVTHAGVIIIMAGGIVTGIGGEKTRIRLVEGEPASAAISAAGPRELPFEILLREFSIEHYGSGDRHELVCVEDGARASSFVDPDAPEPVPLGRDTTVRIVKFFPHFMVGEDKRPANRSREPENPAVLLEVRSGVKRREIWVFANFPLFYKTHGGVADVPDFYYVYTPAQVKQYVSELAVKENGEVVKEGRISVNSPMSWRGFTMYQSSYEPGNDKVSILQVNRDPGVPVVYTGFAVLPLGLLWVLLGSGPASRRRI